MRIYICNIPLNKINIENLFTNDNINFKVENVHELYSQENGIYIMKNNNYFRVESKFNESYDMIKNYTINEENCFDILLDNNITLVPVISQLPVIYILHKLTNYTFFSSKKSSLTLTIKLLGNNVIDFYFEYNDLDKKTNKPNKFDLEILNERFFKEEFNMFLSYLK
jgi:hypothetical protein